MKMISSLSCDSDVVILNMCITNTIFYKEGYIIVIDYLSKSKAKSIKYQGISMVKSRENKASSGKWSQLLGHKQVQNRDKTRCPEGYAVSAGMPHSFHCMKTTGNSVKVTFGIEVKTIGRKSDRFGCKYIFFSFGMSFNIRERHPSYKNVCFTSTSTSNTIQH